MSQKARVLDVPLPLVFDRPFYVDCVVSTHKQLLLKSPMAEVYDDRIDIVFKAVDAVHLSFKLPRVEIRIPTEHEVAGIENAFGENILALPGNQAFIIAGGPSDGYIVASAAYMVKSNLHGANPSPLFFDLEGTERPDVIYRLAS